MTTITIEIDDETVRLLSDLASSEQRSSQDVYREALTLFLRSRKPAAPGSIADRHAAFRKMIGLVKGSPTDSSDEP